jgi:hypothetical protein
MSHVRISPSPLEDVSALARVQGSLAKPRQLGRPGPALRAEKRNVPG